MSNNPELPKNLLESIPWNEEEGAVWIGSALSLRRNLMRYHFPSKLSLPEREQVLETLLKGLQGIEGPHFYRQKELSSSDRELIFEHFLFLKGFEEAPDGAGILIDEKGLFLALFNMVDHLEIEMLDFTNNWDATWHSLATMENQMDKAQGFAFSPKFGYLTSNFTQCGTGLTINAYLHLPALIHSKQIESALAVNEEVHFMGLSGDLNKIIGDIIVVQNHYTIGMSEEAILHAMQNIITKLVGAEKTMRSHLKEKPSHEIKNLISKGFGLLVHAYQLETKEALDLLSLMKLGLTLGEISNVSDRKLSELFFKCRRGHLLHLFPELKEHEEIAKKRASYLQEQLLGIRLTSEG